MQIGQGNMSRCARGRAGGSPSVVLSWRRTSTQQIVALSTGESEYITTTKGAAHGLEVRSAMMENWPTLKVVCETDASVRQVMATRCGVGRVRHLDARLLWLQQLCAEGVVEM